MNQLKHGGRIFQALTLMVAGFVAGLVAGCAADKTPIVFTDERMLPALKTNLVITPPPPSLSKEDETKVELQVFSSLLTRHFWDDGGFTAIFLQADDSEVQALQRKFAGHIPPIKPSYRVDLHPNRVPLDKDTGKPAMILSVDVSEPAADGSVPAIGKWYAGGAVTGFYSFILKKNGDNWEIQDPQ